MAPIFGIKANRRWKQLREPDLKGWKEVIGNLGLGWETTLSPISNIMDGFNKEDFAMLKRADRQMKFDFNKEE